MTANVHSPAEAQKLLSPALIHGYHVAFLWGAALLFAALLTAIFLINATKDDVPQDAAAAMAA